MSLLDEDIGDALALTNVARQAFGLSMLTELPDSKPGDASDCLFYRALSPLGISSVGARGQMQCKDERQAAYLASLWGTSSNGNEVKAPEQFHRVINKFDHQGTRHYETQRKSNY